MWYEFRVSDQDRTKIVISFNPDIAGRCCRYNLELRPRDELMIWMGHYKGKTPLASFSVNPGGERDLMREGLEKVLNVRGQDITLVELTEILNAVNMLPWDLTGLALGPELGPGGPVMEDFNKFLTALLPQAKGVYEKDVMNEIYDGDYPRYNPQKNGFDKLGRIYDDHYVEKTPYVEKAPQLCGIAKRTVRKMEQVCGRSIVTYHKKFSTDHLDVPIQFSSLDIPSMCQKFVLRFGGGRWPKKMTDFLGSKL